MVCGTNFKECPHEKKEHVGNFDIYIECTACFHGTRKEIDSCCLNPEKIFVNLPRADGKPTKREYCRNCGNTSPVIKMDPSNEYLTLPLLDKKVQKETQELRHKRYMAFYEYLKIKRQDATEKETQELKIKYHNYLRTPEWKDRRSKVLKRDNMICQSCLENPATQVHHLTYDHIFNEPLFDLVSVCDSCHDSIHNKAFSA